MGWRLVRVAVGWPRFLLISSTADRRPRTGTYNNFGFRFPGHRRHVAIKERSTFMTPPILLSKRLESGDKFGIGTGLVPWPLAVTTL
jgi:hypothetical protein